MSLPLCTPDKNECVRNLETKYKECLPQCSGLWVRFSEDENFDKDKISFKDKKLESLNYILSKQYWNYKGFYKFPNYDGKVSEIKLL